MSTWDFEDKRVLVTGASRGIGFHIACGFALAGADLHILAETPDIHLARERLLPAKGTVTSDVCDVSDRGAVARVVSQFGPLDVVVNNAGIEYLTPIDEPGEEVEATFRRIIDVNLLGAYYVTREALRSMPDAARILFTASGWAKTGEAGFGAYTASKHAILGLTRCLADELGPRRITVNAVCPGWVRTELSMRSLATLAQRAQRSPDAVMGDILAAQAIPELLEPEDVVSTYLFLASEQGANITGQGINIDRGWVMS